jgi:hypothetical protein
MRHISRSEFLRGDDLNPYSQEPCDNETLDHLPSIVQNTPEHGFPYESLQGFSINRSVLKSNSLST